MAAIREATVTRRRSPVGRRTTRRDFDVRSPFRISLRKGRRAAIEPTTLHFRPLSASSRVDFSTKSGPERHTVMISTEVVSLLLILARADITRASGTTLAMIKVLLLFLDNNFFIIQHVVINVCCS